LPNSAFPPFFREIPAFQNDEIWAMDASAYFSRPAPRVVRGAEILAKIIHPEIFGAPENREAFRVGKDLIKYQN
jgi:iron complex transport system substrate-binding protein